MDTRYLDFGKSRQERPIVQSNDNDQSSSFPPAPESPLLGLHSDKHTGSRPYEPPLPAGEPKGPESGPPRARATSHSLHRYLTHPYPHELTALRLQEPSDPSQAPSIPLPAEIPGVTGKSRPSPTYPLPAASSHHGNQASSGNSISLSPSPPQCPSPKIEAEIEAEDDPDLRGLGFMFGMASVQRM
ncbi:uncharacterized protein DNG_05102 [Cephalotrichum gorgonifer]|uniref:Uncharacterized protein n=1 Tax=Cephalotrichum gorgonifer TaxID=2041049 RepID=A0AAE8SVH0_9PEZI|nr:uncharacterized protein DNG_05102 [Cephalotrichum gorgonifer]